jgi:hypothetical protein
MRVVFQQTKQGVVGHRAEGGVSHLRKLLKALDG